MAQKMLKRKKRPFTEDEQWHEIKCPIERKNLLRFQRSRCQAKFRNEPWDMTFEQWKEVWGNKIDQIGRDSDGFCMRRKDISEPWHKDNVYVIQRTQMLSEKLTDYWSKKGN